MIPVIKINEANELVLQAIGKADSRMILGFLPLSESEEEAILNAVKEQLASFSHTSLIGLLRYAPAAAAYAMAVAPARSCQGGREFWSTYSDDLGISIQAPDRPQISDAFRRACRELGLLDGTIDETAHRHVAPFLFQAGILHRWTGHLAQGIQLALRECPPPEIGDWPALRRFAERVQRKIPQAQCNLRGLLETEVGPLLVRRLVSAYVAQDWGVLPQHLREHLREAFSESGRGAVLKSPYLAFEEALGQMQVVLPAQSSRLASADTRWRIDGRRPSARTETTILVSELPDSILDIELCDLSSDFANQRFEMDFRIDRAVPFRIFRKENGRERKSDAGRDAELAPGNYIILMSEEVATNDEEFVRAVDGLRHIEIDFRPGDDPLILSLGDAEWTIRPQLKQGIYVDRTRCSSAQLEGNNELLHYGDELGLVAYFPADTISDRSFRIGIDCDVKGPLYAGEIEASNRGKSVYVFQDDLQTAMSGALCNLSPGIHRLNVSVSHASGRVDHPLWYWRGLESVGESAGFKCSANPENIKPDSCRGVRVSETGLTFLPGFYAPTVQIGIASPEAVLRLPRAGVQATIKETESEWEEEPPKESLVVIPDDRRLLRFRSGGFQRWDITCNERTLASLDQNRTSIVRSLAGIASELGGSGRIVARGENGSSIALLSFTKPLTATNPTYKQDHGKGEESWIFKVPAEELNGIGVTVRNLTEAPLLFDGEIVPIVQHNGEGHEAVAFQHREGQIVISASCGGYSTKVKVEASFRVNDLNDEWWALDFFRRTDPEGEWLPLECSETHGYSKVRLFAWGPVYPPDDAGWWRRLKRAGRPSEGPTEDLKLATTLSEMSASQLEEGLSACRSLLAWKYPSEVWKANAHRLQDFPVHLGKHRFGNCDDSAALWWKHAALELDEYASISSVPVTRQFLFGSQPASLRAPRECLTQSVQSKTPVGRSLEVPVRIQYSGSLKDFVIKAWENGEVSDEIIPCFENFIAVHSGNESEFRGFSLNQFLTGGVAGVVGLEERTIQLNEKCPRFEVEALFSPEHLLFATRALNRRCRVVDRVSEGEVEHPLARVAQTIEKVFQRLEAIAPQIAQLLGWKSQKTFIWTPPFLENRWSEKVAQLAWVVAALSRLSAHDKVSRSDFDRKMIGIFCSRQPSQRKVQNRLCILMSLAPELFAFYLALFELLFPTKSSN